MSSQRATRLAVTLAVTGISLAVLGTLITPMRFTGFNLAGTVLLWAAAALIFKTTTSRQETRA